MKRKKPKNRHAVGLAKKRAASLTKAQRVAIAKHAAAVRWEGKDYEHQRDLADRRAEFERGLP